MIEMRNLRLINEHNTSRTAIFCDADRIKVVEIPHDDFVKLGKPAYVVVEVRAEKFSESTL